MPEPPLRILLFNTAHRWIGEAAGTHLLARLLHHRGHEVLVAVPEGGRVHEAIAGADYPVAPIPWRMPQGRARDHLRQHAAVRRLLAGFRPGVIHCGRGNEHWAAAMWRPVTAPRAAIVRTRHVVLPMDQGLANRWLFRHGTDAVTAVSSIAMEGLGALADHLPAERRRVVVGAVDMLAYSPHHRSQELRTDLGVTAARPHLVGCLGRLQRIKGYDVFLAAMAGVCARRDDVQAVLAGRKVAADHHKIARLHAEHDLGDRVEYRGTLPDPAALIASLDVGVIASRGSEGFSRIAVEYMASGVPVVATRVGAIPEILRDGELGVLVPPEDPGAMADAILELLGDPARRARLVERARASLVPRFSPDRLAAETEEVYRAALAAR